MPHNRRGFTLVEVMLVAGLTVFLAVLLSSVWRNISLFTTDAVGRGQLMQEMDLTASSFSRDLAGGLPLPANTSFSSGKPDSGRWIAWKTNTDKNELWLCYDGGSCPDGEPDWSGVTDTVICYRLVSDPDGDVATKILIRENESDVPASSFNVARGISSMSVDADGDFAKITLQFKYQQRFGSRYFGPEYLRTLTLEAKVP
jgi:type II secretory pathway pseudopilin PulG